MNKEVSRAWLLNIKPLFGLPFYENKKNSCRNPYEVLAGNKHIFNPNPQRLFWLNTIHSSKTLKRSFYFLKGRWLRNPERLYRSLPNKSQCRQLCLRMDFFCPLRPKSWAPTISNDFCCSWPNFMSWVCFFCFGGLFFSHGRSIVPQQSGKMAISRETSACSSLKRGFGSLPEMDAVLSDNTLASQLCRK